MRQAWRHLGFLHWRVEPGLVKALLPPGLQVDTFDGAAYVSAVPFTIPRSRMAGLGLPLAPAFHELNLRTYVHRGGRDPGIWFFSLDAASRLAVAGARIAYALPYFHAQMAMQVKDVEGNPEVTYSSRRAGGAARADFRGRYWARGAGTQVTVGTLEFFLIERYKLFAWNGKVLTSARVFHEPYSVRSAGADVTETLTAAAGLPGLGPVALVHYAAAVEVRIHRPQRAIE